MITIRTLRLRSPQIALLFCTVPVTAQEEIVETFEDGSVSARYRIDSESRRSGPYVSYHLNGKVWIRTTYREDMISGPYQEYRNDGSPKIKTAYRDDVLHGDYKEFSGDGKRVLSAKFKQGIKHGSLTIVDAKKVLTNQEWSNGEMVKLNGIVPFPRTELAMRADLARIQAAPKTVPGADLDPLLPKRLTALRRLQAYRYLCLLPYEDMALDPAWNELCDYGARLCQAIGHLDHTPPKPAGMDEESYRKGYRGTSRSNLSAGSGMVRSVDSYMNDSDQSNIARIGHRRWCLNPAMKRTGFGEAGRFSAMWSMDSSGSGAKGLPAVHYPPQGRVPIEFFGPRHAWSIQMLKGGHAKPADTKIEIVELDESYIPKAKPLVLDHQGTVGNCLIFRPVGIQVQPGKRYWCEVSTDGGKTVRYRYLVEFI